MILNTLDKRNVIFSVMIECPHGKRLYDCPFKKYSNLDLKEKFTVSNEMSEEKVEEMFSFHQRRSQARDQIYKN